MEYRNYVLFPILFFGLFAGMWVIGLVDLYRNFGCYETHWYIGIEKNIFEKKFIEYLKRKYDM